MNKIKNGPITPYNLINDPNYLHELEIRKPKPRIRPEDKWIKDIHEKGTVGLLFELQALENEMREIQIYRQQRLSII